MPVGADRELRALIRAEHAPRGLGIHGNPARRAGFGRCEVDPDPVRQPGLGQQRVRLLGQRDALQRRPVDPVQAPGSELRDQGLVKLAHRQLFPSAAPGQAVMPLGSGRYGSRVVGSMPWARK